MTTPINTQNEYLANVPENPKESMKKLQQVINKNLPDDSRNSFWNLQCELVNEITEIVTIILLFEKKERDQKSISTNN